MTKVLLLGAGFSRNWGGWLAAEVFEYLLGHPAINEPLRHLLFRHKRSGGFEGAMAELQTERGPRELLPQLNTAVIDMFNDMDRAFEGTQFEFQNQREYQIGPFLTRFDAIFTLNQDLLLERHYLNDNVMLNGNGKWDGWCIPGMRRSRLPDDPRAPTSLALWLPDERNFVVPPRLQPLFKLHGSSNWRTAADHNIMILGGNKPQFINQHPVLRSNFEHFDQYLRTPNARLMIIGYGFADSHVNNVIINAVRASNVTMFVVDPLGLDVMDENRNATIYKPGATAEALWPRVNGASRRPLTSTFRDDRAEHAKVMAFLR